MAIKIIKHGKKIFKITCPICDCEFEYEYEDLVDQCGPIKKVKCPDCGEWLTHKDGKSIKPEEKDITWKFSKPGELISYSDKSYNINYTYPYTHPYTLWTNNIPNWPDCDTCINKPDPNKPIQFGDSPCTYCKKNQPYCASFKGENK